MRIAKWGNSLAIRITAAVVEVLQLKAGDEVEISATGRRRWEISRTSEREELLKRLRKHRGLMPSGFRFDRLEAHERR